MTVETTDYTYQIPVTTKINVFRDYRNSPAISVIFEWISPISGKSNKGSVYLATGVSYQDLMEKSIELFKDPVKVHETINTQIQKEIASALRWEVPVDIYEQATEDEFKAALSTFDFNFTAPIDLKQSIQPQA
ncbi:hypothetical protein_gp188 [Bacillus phage vB_BceM_WH1]|nr:hypothetical protein_gp188 [Bacillus phage vB_BceM_WH1]